MTWIWLQSSARLTFNPPGPCPGGAATRLVGCLGRRRRTEAASPSGTPPSPRLRVGGGLGTSSAPAPPPAPSALPAPPPPPESPAGGGPAVWGEGGRAQVDGPGGAGGRGCLLPPARGVESCFSERSSVLTAADAPPHGWGERAGGAVPSGPAPPEPGLLPRSRSQPGEPARRRRSRELSSVWRSHSAPRHLRGQAAREADEPLALHLARGRRGARARGLQASAPWSAVAGTLVADEPRTRSPGDAWHGPAGAH